MSGRFPEETTCETDLTAALVVASFLTLAGPPPSRAGDEQAVVAAVAPATINCSFKLDPRVSGPTYGGERWVSPRTYTGASAQDTVEARALAVDAKGRRVHAGVEWTSSDPDVVTVAPARGEQVRITARLAGESTVTVRSGAASRRLTIKVAQANGAWQVSITQ